MCQAVLDQPPPSGRAPRQHGELSSGHAFLHVEHVVDVVPRLVASDEAGSG
jgi:hypothetical protein